MKYYVIRRVKDRITYGKNYHTRTTGNNKPRHGFDKTFQPYLYSTYQRAALAIITNKVLLNEPSKLEIVVCELVFKPIEDEEL